MKPLLQLFGLVLTDIWAKQKPPRRAKITQHQAEIKTIESQFDLSNEEEKKKCDKKVAKLKDKEIEALIFEKYLRETNNAKKGNQAITKFFGK